MTIFEKIQKVRVGLKNSKIKMSGKNSYAGYDYFELCDFLPTLNDLMLEVGMTAIPSFTSDEATLTAINFEDTNDRFVITSPFSSAELKGCHAVQNVGAVETYQRRYLYQAMFDIAESDGLNAVQGKSENKQAFTQKKAENKPSSTPKSGEKGLPFPEQGVSDKKPSKDEIKANRRAELAEMQVIYYNTDTDEQWISRLKGYTNEHGKVSDMSEEAYINLLKKIKNKEI